MSEYPTGAEPVKASTEVGAEAGAEAQAEAAAQMLSVDARAVIGVGTALFFIAFLALLPAYGWLGDHGHRVWLWTSLAGWIMGVAAFPLIRKHAHEGRLG